MEGSRRSCPTDGSNLIPDVAESGQRQSTARIFSEMDPGTVPASEFDKTLSDIPHPATQVSSNISNPYGKKSSADNIFFELDESEPDLLSITECLEPQDPALYPPQPVTRKVNPNDIPAGHVDLGDSDRPPPFAADFDGDDPESFVGRTVKGRYQVTEFLGGDENGFAYLADDKIVDDKKILLRILLGGESDELINSILAEERISLSHFSHPNIARLIDSGQFTDGTDFLVNEYVDALSVRDILGIHGRFGEVRAARIIRQAANALNEAHQEGILHRDLRPENLIVDTLYEDGEHATLVNFGASSGEPTEVNIAYKAPEVLDGRVGTVASDVYSLGIMAYEMLTGQMPFDGSTAREIFRSQYAGLTRLPSEIRPELPEAVDQVLDKALSFKAKERYAKARDFGDAFYAALTESPQHVNAVGEILDSTETAVPPTPLPLLRLGAEADRSKAPALLSIITADPAGPAYDRAPKIRPPKPPSVVNLRTKMTVVIGLVILLLLLAIGFYFVSEIIRPN